MEFFDSRLSALAISAPAFWERARDTLAHAGQTCHHFTGRTYNLKTACDFWSEPLHLVNADGTFELVDKRETYIFRGSSHGKGGQRLVIETGTAFAKHIKFHTDKLGRPQYLEFAPPSVIAPLPTEIAHHPAFRMIGHDMLVGYNHLIVKADRPCTLVVAMDIFSVKMSEWMATVINTSAKKKLQTRRAPLRRARSGAHASKPGLDAVMVS